MQRLQSYIIISIELNLFFARIMKEHALFLAAGFTPVNASLAREANTFRMHFEELLAQAAHLGDGVIRPAVLRSGELVTEFTSGAEQITQQFTGIAIDRRITAFEERMLAQEGFSVSLELAEQTRQLNKNALRLVQGLIAFKQRVLENAGACRIFTMNYPLLIRHIIREAELYRSYLTELESGRMVNDMGMRRTEQFWNRIMMEHAMFIRGLLDPSEAALIKTSDDFAQDYARLLERSRGQNELASSKQSASLAETLKFRDFKAAGTKGICNCEIQSIILPLLADHVLREANHYIRLLSR